MSARGASETASFDISRSYRRGADREQRQRIVIRAQARTVPEVETEVMVYDELKRIDIVNRPRARKQYGKKEAVYLAFPSLCKLLR
jgi:hypothetical protein